MREDLVMPPTARRLQRAGFAWEPQVGDWCMVLGGEHFRETQSGLWLVVGYVALTGQLGVMDASGLWPASPIASQDAVWLPSVGKLKMWLRSRGWRVNTGEVEAAGLGSGVRHMCRVHETGRVAPLAEGQGVSEAEAVADAVLRLLESAPPNTAATGTPGTEPGHGTPAGW